MKPTAMLLGLLILAGSVVSAQSQHPNFSGEWSPDTERTIKNMQPAGGASWGRGSVPGGRIDMAVMQDAATLTIVKQTPAGERKIVYNFDGSDTKGEGPSTIKARWDGDRLLIETTIPARDPGSPPLVTRSALYLEGQSLVLEEFSDNSAQSIKNYYKRLRG